MLKPTYFAFLALVVLAGCSTDSDGEGIPQWPDVGTQAPVDDAEDGRDSENQDTSLEPDVDTSDVGGEDAIEEQDTSPDVPQPPDYLSAGCGSAPSLSEGETTLTIEGQERLYVLRLPQNYDVNRPYPLVFALHGNGGNTSYWDTDSGVRNIRGEFGDEAIIVVPLAIDNQWRDYSQPEVWDARIESELLYFDAIHAQLTGDLCIDTRAIFSMGFSGGGSFSGLLGCHRDYIRGIAVGGSVIYFDPSECVSTPAAWITIGTEELTGGREDYRDFFRDRAGCSTTTTPTEPGPCVAYDGCDAEYPVHYCQHPGDHVWPDFGVGAAWSFFQSLIPE